MSTKVSCVTCGSSAVINPPLRPGETLRHEHTFSTAKNRYVDLGWFVVSGTQA
jgi:hypothetical protein